MAFGGSLNRNNSIGRDQNTLQYRAREFRRKYPKERRTREDKLMRDWRPCRVVESSAQARRAARGSSTSQVLFPETFSAPTYVGPHVAPRHHSNTLPYPLWDEPQLTLQLPKHAIETSTRQIERVHNLWRNLSGLLHFQIKISGVSCR